MAISALIGVALLASPAVGRSGVATASTAPAASTAATAASTAATAAATAATAETAATAARTATTKPPISDTPPTVVAHPRRSTAETAETAAETAADAAAKPRAWILVDDSTGVVLSAGNDRQPLPPASLTKLLTALIAVGRLQPTDTMTVSPIAAAEPASKIGMKVGQVWTFQNALYSLLLASANDAAVAIAERVGGSLSGFAELMAQTGQQLGLQDHPVLHDPAGLDDGTAVDGGNLLSARDLAIVSRAVLAEPLLAQVVATPQYDFTGPDGVQHELRNHNILLETYQGTIGMKTGYTVKAGEDLIAAARRNGRTLIAIVMGAPSLWNDATSLLNQGFAMPATAEAIGIGDTLPAVVVPGVTADGVGVAEVARSNDDRAGTKHHGGWQPPILLLVLIVAAAGVAVALRRHQVMGRRRSRRRDQLLTALAEVMAARSVRPEARPERPPDHEEATAEDYRRQAAGVG